VTLDNQMASRLLCAAVIAMSLSLSLACADLWLQKEFAFAGSAAALAIAAVVIGRRLIRSLTGASFYVTAIVAAAGLVIISAIVPYRVTTERWHLAPDTYAALIVFESLHLMGATLGAYIGTYITIARSRDVTSIGRL